MHDVGLGLRLHMLGLGLDMLGLGLDMYDFENGGLWESNLGAFGFWLDGLVR